MAGKLISEDSSLYIHVFEFGPILDLNINHRMFPGDRRGVLSGEFRKPTTTHAAESHSSISSSCPNEGTQHVSEL